jgi:hypothetical protein
MFAQAFDGNVRNELKGFAVTAKTCAMKFVGFVVDMSIKSMSAEAVVPFLDESTLFSLRIHEVQTIIMKFK